MISELSGPFKNLIYIYDHYLQQSLTNWVECSEGDNAEKINDALVLLRERIADFYVRDLQCDQISSLLARVWGNLEVQTWAKVREGLIIIEKDAEPQDPSQESTEASEFSAKSSTQLAESTQEVALDWVKMTYIPELQPAKKSSSIEPDSSILEDVIVNVASASLERFLESTVLNTSIRLIAGAVGGPLISMAVGAIFSQLWGNNNQPLSEKEVRNMINERVDEAINSAGSTISPHDKSVSYLMISATEVTAHH